MTAELWRPIPGFPGYEASNRGRIRSLNRPELKATPGPCGFRTVTLRSAERATWRVGSLVAAAWLGPRPEGAAVRRLNGDPLDDRLENLQYGTKTEEREDYARRARREEEAGAPTHCDKGHRYADTYVGSWSERHCPACKREVERERYWSGPDRSRVKDEAWYLAQAEKCRARGLGDVGADPSELWRPIPGFPGYEASNRGRILSLRGSRPKILKPTSGRSPAPCGYYCVGLPVGETEFWPSPSRQAAFASLRIGLLVARAWLGPMPEGLTVRHLNGVTTDDRVENLAYGTHAQVMADFATRARREEAAGAPTHCGTCGSRYKDSWHQNFGERLCGHCRNKRTSEYWKRHPEKRRAQVRRWYARHGAERRAARRAANAAKPPRTTRCLDCSSSIEASRTGPLPKRCHDCKKRAQQEASKRYESKRKAARQSKVTTTRRAA